MIGIIDYNAGNIKSLERALDFLGEKYILSKNPANLMNVDRVIFPGDGEAAYAMGELEKSGYDRFLHEWAASKKPLLGICIGAQIIFDKSEEGGSFKDGVQTYTKCLGLVPGTIRHFSGLWKERDILESHDVLKVPHMGWNDLTIANGGCPILKGISDGANFYFVHSYVIQPHNPEVIKGFANYGCMVPSVIQHRNIFACQFHPEKSGQPGLRILKNFITEKLG